MGKSCRMPMVNAHNDLPRRERVFAVRDFPPGCGWFASSRPSEKAACVGAVGNSVPRERIDDKFCNNCFGAPEIMLGSKSLGVLQKLDTVMNGQANHVMSPVEEQVVLSDQEKATKIEVEDDTEVVDPLKAEALQHKASDLSMSVQKVDDDTASLSKVVLRKYPPRGRISAVRAFPRFCGGTDPTFSTEESKEALSNSRNMRFGEEPAKVMLRTCLEPSICKSRPLNRYDGSSLATNREVVMGLMATENSPWRHEQGKLKQPKSAFRRKNEEETYEGTGSCIMKNSSLIRNSSQDMDQMITVDREDQSCSKVDENVSNTAREKVKESLDLFRKLLKEGSVRRIDLQAAKVLQGKGKYVNVGKQIIGSVPGVEVGDKFLYRVELNIVGLHRQSQGGIDYVKQDQNIYATSIVASGGYDDNVVDSDVLVYTGSGGNMMNANKEPEDQKLERGNLALKNSVDSQNPVRVIRGLPNPSDALAKTYIYDGQYLVKKYWQERGSHGKLVYKFALVRIPGQPEVAALKRSRNH